ncbi:Nramp family divalent metal transporter [uncultured Chloroflexus sp.]|uniref:Nramp family divalent metal transporter n=1 Tax=uncultured Chloroflexus sp. TaxID=214040 RepID=UPI002618458C|nr:Nramp family divalent metal transporter [uncultured Chloroflexus sp.]
MDAVPHTRPSRTKLFHLESFYQRVLRLLPFLGPAFVAAVAYIDPGNIATAVQAGARFGVMLLWVVVASNLAAMLIQALSAKVGIATGHSLAELCREHVPQPVVWVMWLISELAAIATDLAEFIGAAIGFQLLFGLPLLLGGVLTALVTWLIIGLERRGFRRLEAVIAGLLFTVAGCYVAELAFGRPDWREVSFHAVVPQLAGTDSLILAAGILGATVMPHAIFLHSALTQRRIVGRTEAERRAIYRFELVDMIIALSIAGLVNAAMMIMAATAFYRHGLYDVATIEGAYQSLTPLFGSSASIIFGIALLSAGISSSAVGTLAGQTIMQGFLRWETPLWVRRIITMAPALVVIALGIDPTWALVLSQVALSFALPFALIPLIWFTSQRHLMGSLRNRWLTTVVASVITAVIILLNIALIVQAVIA